VVVKVAMIQTYSKLYKTLTVVSDPRRSLLYRLRCLDTKCTRVQRY